MSNWDVFWSKKLSLNFNPIFSFIHHKNVFHVYKKFLDHIKIKNPEIIELGCGTGELTIRIIKRYGGNATLIDKSENALKITKSKFEKNHIPVKIIRKNLLNFKPSKKYDFCHSEGLIEHFTIKKQKKILELHKKCTKRNGYILISVPRKIWFLKMWKRFLIYINKWPFGYEEMMTENELKSLIEALKVKVLYSVAYGRYVFVLAKI